MQTVLITGGTGFVGKELTNELVKKGYEVIILTRKIPTDNGNIKSGISYAIWDVNKKMIDITAIQKADHIIHLAGAGVVDKKWTVAYKKEIEDSRTKSSGLITETLKNNTHKVKTVVSASAIGWYGTDIITGKAFVETDAADNSFLGKICKLWEAGIEPIEQLGIRLVKLRTGIVLGNGGGAFEEFKKPLQFGVASILGSGKQIVSWIHIEDLCRLYITAVENDKLTGSYNAVAPMPVTNKDLAITLAKEMRGSFFIPIYVPRSILQIMLGDRSIEVLKSATVSCSKIKQTGFTFLYPSIEAALQELCKKQ
jgi:uncharacterized protein (TIGR01777 family)